MSSSQNAKLNGVNHTHQSKLVLTGLIELGKTLTADLEQKGHQPPVHTGFEYLDQAANYTLSFFGVPTNQQYADKANNIITELISKTCTQQENDKQDDMFATKILSAIQELHDVYLEMQANKVTGTTLTRIAKTIESYGFSLETAAFTKEVEAIGTVLRRKY